MEIMPFNQIKYSTANGEKCIAAKIKDQSKVSLEKSPAQDTVSFGSKKNAVEDAAKEKKKSGFLKKAAVAFASASIPGLGQAINGQWGKAAFYAIGAPILTVGAFFAINPLAGLLVGGVLEIANIVSAYRNA